MNPHEARLKVFETIRDFFVEMGADGESLTPQEQAEVKESLAELTELMLELLRLEVESVEETESGTLITAKLYV